MVTEEEIFSGYLLQRTDFEKTLSFEQFQTYFPRGTKIRLIERIYSHLKRVAHRRLQNISAAIEQHQDRHKDVNITHKDIQELEEVNLITIVNHKLNDLDKILDDELKTKRSILTRQSLEMRETINNVKQLSANIGKEENIERFKSISEKLDKATEFLNE